MTIQEYIEQRAGGSQSKAAIALKISRPFLNQIVSGARFPSEPMKRKILETSEGLITLSSWVPGGE